MHTRRLPGVAALGLAALALTLAGTGGAQAAFITGGPATTISGDADVRTDGALVGALNLGNRSVSDAPVNGVPFQAAAFLGSNSETFGNFTFTMEGTGSFAPFGPSTSGNPPFASLSADYRALLSSGTSVIEVSAFPSFTLAMTG